MPITLTSALTYTYPVRMPEPKDGREGLTIPAGFNPDKHCGAKLRNKSTVCMAAVGQGTELPGDPTKRCFRHGGISGTLKDGNKSVTYGTQRPRIHRARLRDQIEEMKRNPDLLALDEQIATLKAVIARKIELSEDQWDRYDDYMEAVADAAQTSGVLPDPVMLPDLPKEEMALLGRLVAQEYEMRFSKRFSVPILEVTAMITKIATDFNEVARRYNLPMEAREMFARRLAGVKVSKLPDDPQLSRAGLGPIQEVPALKDAISGELLNNGDSDAAG